eukprot:GHVU01197049.1.p1 GENE.GHVU01197049.1~~GHVU01197049.1.p1  ORF type:complete len:119 (-),score=2.50 GHVU01197049.1:241-597(-)
MNAHTPAHMRTRTHTHTRTHARARAHTHTHTRTHARAHAHTHTPPPAPPNATSTCSVRDSFSTPPTCDPRIDSLLDIIYIYIYTLYIQQAYLCLFVRNMNEYMSEYMDTRLYVRACMS